MKKHRIKSITDNLELCYEEEMHNLADALAENDKNTPHLLDPFDDYIDGIKTKIHANPHIFRSRLVKGYNALLHVLQDIENPPN